MQLTGIHHLTAVTANAPGNRGFYEGVLGLAPMFRDDRLTAYPVGLRSALLIFRRGAATETAHLPGGTIPPHDGHGPLHVAFAIAREDLAGWEAHLARHGIEIEGRTDWRRAGTSVYFRDPDGSLLEFIAYG